MKRNTRRKPLHWLRLPLFLMFLSASSIAGAAVPGVPVPSAPRPIWSPYIQGALPDPPTIPFFQPHPGLTPSAPTSWRPQAATSRRWPHTVPSTALPQTYPQPGAPWAAKPVWQASPAISSFYGRYPVIGHIPAFHPYQPQLGRPPVNTPISGVSSHQPFLIRRGGPR